MALTETSGSTTTVGTTETNLFEITTGGPKYFSGYAFLHNLTATETIQFFVYVYDVNASAYRLYQGPDDGLQYSGVQGSPARFVVPVPSKQFKVTTKMTAGTNRAITWVLYEQTA
jgi:hypothetical protein